MMGIAVAGILSIFLAPQDPPPAQEDIAKQLEELTKRVESLEKERDRLLEQVDRLEKFGAESAEMISRLKKMLRDGGQQIPAPAEGPLKEGTSKVAGQAAPGPATPVQGKILTVVPDRAFMIVLLGEDDGIR